MKQRYLKTGELNFSRYEFLITVFLLSYERVDIEGI